MSAKLSRSYRAWLYGTFFSLFVSGALWFVLNRGRISNGGPSAFEGFSLEPLLMKIHGAAAMIFLIVLGTLIPAHIKKGLKAKKNLLSGYALLGVMGFLVASGYLLYYAGNEAFRSVTSWLHTLVGLGTPVLLIWHLLFRRREGKVKTHSVKGKAHS